MALGFNSFQGYDRRSIIAGPTQPHYQLLFCLLANATQLERWSWEAESREVFSDSSCNAFTRQLPLIQALEYKIICFVISQLFTDLHGLKFLQHLYIVHFSHEIGRGASQGVGGRKNGPCGRSCTFLFKFSLNGTGLDYCTLTYPPIKLFWLYKFVKPNTFSSS